MSLLYSIRVLLDAGFQEKYIKIILDHGKDLGFVYYDIDGNVLTTAASAKYRLNNTEFAENTSYIYVNSKQIGSFLIGFYSEDGQLKLSLGSFGVPIRKDFLYSSYAVDWATYIRLFLPLIEGFAIVKLEADAF